MVLLPKTDQNWADAGCGSDERHRAMEDSTLIILRMPERTSLPIGGYAERYRDSYTAIIYVETGLVLTLPI